jgi:hypothetical protein
VREIPGGCSPPSCASGAGICRRESLSGSPPYTPTHMSAYVSIRVSIRQHIVAIWKSSLYTNPYVSIRQHTSAYVSGSTQDVPHQHPLRATHASAYVSNRQHTSAYASIRRMRQHTSAYVSIRQHASAYASIRQHTSAVAHKTLPPRVAICNYSCLYTRCYMLHSTYI